MQEEIFGPILPIVCVESVNEAIDFIKSKPKPLSLYIFSEKKAKVKQIIEVRTVSAYLPVIYQISFMVFSLLQKVEIFFMQGDASLGGLIVLTLPHYCH